MGEHHVKNLKLILLCFLHYSSIPQNELSLKPHNFNCCEVCTCARADEGTLSMPFVKCIANGHPTTYQISTQSAELLPSYSNISFL